MTKQDNYITITEFCNSHSITTQFIIQLHEFGLLEIIKKRKIYYLSHEELSKAEKIVRLYKDLDINLEGIEVINQLLHRIESLQGEIISLKNRLRLYE
jgi:hypothetical protein